MRIIKIIMTGVLVLLVCLSLGLFIFLKTLDLNRFKGQITSQITKAIGHDVNMRHVSFNFSLTQGVTLRMSGLAIADLPSFSEESMLYVDSAYLDVDILAFLLKRQIMASKIELHSLTVNVIRKDTGEINFQEWTKKKTMSEEAADNGVVKKTNNGFSEEEKIGAEDLGFREILIRSIQITDGRVTFTDQMTDPVTTIAVTEVDFQVSNFSLDASFPFQCKASLWSGRPNIEFAGLARIDVQNRQVRIDDLKIQTDLANLSMDRVFEGIPAAKDAGLIGALDGKLLIDVHQMILGQAGVLVLSSDGEIMGIKAQFAKAPLPIEDLNIRFAMTESDLEIKEIRMPLASGEMNITGRLIEYLAEQKYSGDLKVAKVQLGELAVQMGLPVKLEGQLQGEAAIDGKGISGNDWRSSLTGKGAAEVQNGRILDVNILRQVLSRIAFIPDLVNQIERNLPEKYKEKLKTKDTVLEKVEMDVKIHEGNVFFNRVEMVADGFLVLASGKMDFDQNLSLSADLYVPVDLSASMVAVSDDLKYFLDENKKIHIPFKPYSGKVSNFRMYPDVEDLGKEAIRNRGREELENVLRKALDLERKESRETMPDSTGGSRSSGEDQEMETPQKSKPRPEELIIENILDMIPIFK